MDRPRFLVQKTVEIDASHHLREYAGKCANPHGHRWRITVEIGSMTIGTDGMVIDFAEVSSVTKAFDHCDINTVSPFDKTNPTAENIARFFCNEIHSRVSKRVIPTHVVVTVEETPGSLVSYRR